MPPLRFVILWHDGVPEPHFDLMFETYPGSPLAAWRSPHWPIEASTPVTRLKDHRREYLDYEGDLTDRRGRVTRVAGGGCHLEIGEAAVWTVAFHGPGLPSALVLRWAGGERWEADSA